ncbi:hypothetical protein FHG87_011316 [Trinorchestia longiramus]|nr:hypothetical protein FHG87_011316 [Trinorchestia longiramus]
MLRRRNSKGGSNQENPRQTTATNITNSAMSNNGSCRCPAVLQAHFREELRNRRVPAKLLAQDAQLDKRCNVLFHTKPILTRDHKAIVNGIFLGKCTFSLKICNT